MTIYKGANFSWEFDYRPGGNTPDLRGKTLSLIFTAGVGETAPLLSRRSDASDAEIFVKADDPGNVIQVALSKETTALLEARRNVVYDIALIEGDDVSLLFQVCDEVVAIAPRS